MSVYPLLVKHESMLGITDITPQFCPPHGKLLFFSLNRLVVAPIDSYVTGGIGTLGHSPKNKVPGEMTSQEKCKVENPTCLCS